jgi:hypothetical protein
MNSLLSGPGPKQVGKAKIKDDFIKFTKTSIDLDGSGAYTWDDEGTDKLANAFSRGKIPDAVDKSSDKKRKGRWVYKSKGKDGKEKDDMIVGAETENGDGVNPVFEDDCNTMKSQTSLKKPNGQYYNSEDDDFIASNPALKKFGINIGDYVSVTYGNNTVKHVRVADNGPKTSPPYVQGTLEMSVHLYQQFKTLGKHLPKGINSRTLKPFRNMKWNYPDDLEVRVQKE